MLKNKKILTILLAIVMVLAIPNMVNAEETTVTVERNIYSNNGSMKFTFTGLTLDKTHEYEFGLTKTSASQVEKWFDITEYTENTAIIDIMTTTKEMRTVINAVDTGYITIKDKTADTVILQPYGVDLRTPFLNLTNYTVINNGKEFGYGTTNGINIALRCASNSQPYYQYQKITDQNIINKYKEIKSNNGDFNSLQSILTTNIPSSNWTTWSYWNGHDSLNGMNGYGYPQSPVNVPDSGLYYLWIYFSGNNLKPLYGYILVDNLESEIVLDSISLPSTKTVKLGETLTLTPMFNPENATNKIVTWESSDETVATVDNVGKVTPVKVGSTIITVTSQDGNKKATCTVTVTETTETVAVTSVSLNKTKLTLQEGKTETLTATVSPSNATNKAVTYKSLDETVAKVDANGKVTAVKAGTATITVTTADGNKTATCAVTVEKTPTKEPAEESTEAPTKLPNTGNTVFITIGIVALIVLSAIGVIKYKKFSKIV